ncbi:MAG TPA: YggT family protein [Syntrophomonadaceae bacterium]|nr:YggT family protein [Syntrophomonadaceae bacterium]
MGLFGLGRFSVGDLLMTALEVLKWLVVVRCLLSYIPHNPYQPIIKFVYDVTEPFMAPFRRIIPLAGAVDFSPILLFFVIQIVQSLVGRYL